MNPGCMGGTTPTGTGWGAMKVLTGKAGADWEAGAAGGGWSSGCGAGAGAEVGCCWALTVFETSSNQRSASEGVRLWLPWKRLGEAAPEEVLLHSVPGKESMGKSLIFPLLILLLVRKTGRCTQEHTGLLPPWLKDVPNTGSIFMHPLNCSVLGRHSSRWGR